MNKTNQWRDVLPLDDHATKQTAELEAINRKLSMMLQRDAEKNSSVAAVQPTSSETELKVYVEGTNNPSKTYEALTIRTYVQSQIWANVTDFQTWMGNRDLVSLMTFFKNIGYLNMYSFNYDAANDYITVWCDTCFHVLHDITNILDPNREVVRSDFRLDYSNMKYIWRCNESNHWTFDQF